MKRWFGIAAPVVALAVLASCAAYLRGSRNLYSGDLIRVPHDKHKANGVDCVNCHETITDAKNLDVNQRPLEDKCMECHQDDKDKGKCPLCHTDVRKAGPYPKRERHLTFDHSAHIPRVKEECERCHVNLPSGPNPVRKEQDTPSMEACKGCHVHRDQMNAGQCEVCHQDLHRYPLKPISSFTHNGNWVKLHSRDARSATDSCQKCHEQTFCADCHAKTVSTRIEIKYSENVDSDYIHRNDWLTRHSIEARADQTVCQRCHGTSFCIDCHTAQNLTPTAANPRSPHPSGWVWPSSPNFHGPAARRDIASCAACHDQGARSICVDCHKVGGIGGNPHPPGYTAQHPATEIRQNGMCLICHQ